jgi:hypothetical protein
VTKTFGKNGERNAVLEKQQIIDGQAFQIEILTAVRLYNEDITEADPCERGCT